AAGCSKTSDIRAGISRHPKFTDSRILGTVWGQTWSQGRHFPRYLWYARERLRIPSCRLSVDQSHLFVSYSLSHELVISPIVEGLLGGFPTLQAGLNAYISDSTHAGTSRAKIFARFFGFLFVGAAAGPTISNLLPLNPFYSSIALGTANLVLVLLLLPESLTQEKRMTLAASRVLVEAEAPRPENQIWVKRMSSYVIGTLRGTFEPMAILLPRKWDSDHAILYLDITGI
ncbi:hypothetical protein RSAG8_07885, partial [Rhizoctonia solani AG-8 WAC10335]